MIIVRVISFLIFTLFFNSNLIAEESCTDKRKVWIEYLKNDMRKVFNQAVFSNSVCEAELIAHSGKTIEEHKYYYANEKRDDFKNIDSRERIESISNLFSDINVDKDIK